MAEGCPFCEPAPARVFHASTHIVGLWDAFPVNPGHALLVTRRHVGDWFAASEDERRELMAATEVAKAAIVAQRAAGGISPPDGFNIGINVGEAAGQTVDHLHVHVIPRDTGDTADPRGGVRLAVPERGKPSTPTPALSLFGIAPHHRSVIAGTEADPLLPHLLAHLSRTTRLDMAVAFVLPKGVEAIYGRLVELLERGGRLRMVTGDYLEATDPDALLRLLDLASEFPEQVQLRVYQTRGGRSFHPKAYILEAADGDGIAFIGSSNLSEAALRRGVEWNYRMVSTHGGEGYHLARSAFEALLRDPATTAITRAWVDAYRARRPFLYREPQHSGPGQPAAAADAPPATAHETAPEVEPEPLPPATPTDLQREALAALAQTRDEGNGAGLVVMATGLGKTWLAAFDVARHGGRALFVAHREEILRQAHRTFRRVMPRATLGFYTRAAKDTDCDVLFASVQSLSRPEHLQRFAPDQFAHLTLDEFHHADAQTYRRLLEHFSPQFLLGLTATPERADGGDLLALCGENLVFRADLIEGIERNLLVPFHYFGVPDEVEYDQIPWRSGRFSEAELTAAVATERRAQNAYEQLQRHGGQRVLAFCVSITHADFMTDWFAAHGLRAAAVHTGARAIPRTEAVDQLERGSLDVLCTVDMFNEGVDIPTVDTVLMLRPTESKVLWLQQIGRGLRLAEGKDHLAIVDYVGNHRTFLRGVEALFDLPASPIALRKHIMALREHGGTMELPGGCRVIYELEALDLLQQLTRISKKADALRAWVIDFRDRHGRRPAATEAWREGFDPHKLPKALGPWLQALRDLEALDPPEAAAWQDPACRAVLEAVTTTSMNRSYKMILLLGWIEAGPFPEPIALQSLTAGFQKVAMRAGALGLDVSVELDDTPELQKLLRKNPIRYLQTDGIVTPEQDQLTLTTPIATSHAPALRELVRELAEWRLAAYLHGTRADRRARIVDDTGTELDARFTTERTADGHFALILESRGGTGAKARNKEYAQGLRVLLARLKAQGARLERVELATREVDGEVLALKGSGYPVGLQAIENLEELAKAIERAQGHNPTRRIRMVVSGTGVASGRALHGVMRGSRA